MTHQTVSEIKRQAMQDAIRATRLSDPEVTTIYRWEIEDGPVVPNLTGTGQIRVEVVKLEEVGDYVDLTVQGRPVNKKGERMQNRPYFDQADWPTREMYAEVVGDWKRSR